MCIWYNSGQLFFYVKSGESQRCEPFRCRNVYSHVFAQVRKMSISDIQEHSQNHGIIFDDIYVLNPSRISDLRLMQWSIQGLLWRIRSKSPPKKIKETWRCTEILVEFFWCSNQSRHLMASFCIAWFAPWNSWTSGKDDFSHSMCFPFADQCLDSWLKRSSFFQSPNPTILSLTASLHISLRFLVLALVIMYILAVLRAGSFLQPFMRPIYMFLPEAWDETNRHKIWILGWDQMVYILVGQRLSLLQEFVLHKGKRGQMIRWSLGG